MSLHEPEPPSEPAGPSRSADEAGPPDVRWDSTESTTADPTEPTPAVPTEPVATRRRGPDGVRPIHLALVVVALLAGAALFLSGYSLGARTATTPGTPIGQEGLWAPFWDTWHAISQEYAGGPVDQQKLVEGAIKGMVDALGDPYSSYYSPDDYKQTLQSISGQFEGIGAEMGTKQATGGTGGASGGTSDGTTVGCTTLGPDCALVVVAPIDGSPAAKAGLRSGDVVTQVDGTPVSGLAFEESVKKVRGPKGTPVTLTIVRDGGAPFDLTIVRDVIVQKEVTTRSLAGGSVGYVRIAGFSDAAANDVVSALEADVAAGQKKLIVDLRGNPGGFITAARRVASQFIASGPIYWTEDAQGARVATDAEAGGVATDPSIRVVVLVDQGSASASEIVAGALQDTKRAVLVGETTFGKGTVQQWQPLENDAGGFKLTVAKWLTPDKRWVHHTGLTPDVPVAVPADTPVGRDPILDRALELLASQASLDAAA